MPEGQDHDLIEPGLIVKAFVNERYGPPEILEIRELPKPVPKAGEILIRVHATSVGRTDTCALRGHPFFMRLQTGLFRPKYTILGLDFAGVVEAIGPGTTRFAMGDRVFGLTEGGHGAHAEYVCVSEHGAVASMPPPTRFADVVVGEGAWYADTYLRHFRLGPGHSILIYGASGAIGTAAVQLAKSYGAHVTAVVATAHLDLVRDLGADRVVDYTAEDFRQIDSSFDFILDAVGKTTYFDCRGLLEPGGVFSVTDLGPGGQNIALALWSRLPRSGRVAMPMPRSEPTFVAFLRDRLASGDFRAVIDRTYPLAEIAEAYRYVETEQKVGIVVIDVVARESSS